MSNRTLFARPELGALLCGGCGGEGSVDGPAGIDACGRCMRRAEADWREQEQTRRQTMWEEQVNRTGAGAHGSAVVMEAKRGRLVLTLGRAALAALPWFRGGTTVAVLLGSGADAGRLAGGAGRHARAAHGG